MSRENAARRNRALRKIRQCRKLSLEIKATVEAILDCLNPRTDYVIAWPSATTLAEKLNRSVRTIRWHLKAIKRTGIFECLHLTPSQASEFIERKFGYKPSLDRCSCQAPTLYLVNEDHWLWDSSTRVTAEMDQRLADVVREVLAARNRHKKRVVEDHDQVRQQAPRLISKSRSGYDLSAIRANLNRFLTSAQGRGTTSRALQPGDVVNDTVRNVVGDTGRNVVGVTQERETKEETSEAFSSCVPLDVPPTLPFSEATELPIFDSSIAVAKATARVELRSRDEADKSSSFLPLRSDPFRFRMKQGVMEDDVEQEDDDLSEEEWCSLEQELLSLGDEDDEPYDELTALHSHHSAPPSIFRN